MTDQAPALRRGREGGRWLNERPTPQEFAEWFTSAMKIDPALSAANYVGGVVLIPGVEGRVPNVSGFNNRGAPVIEYREELAYTPYAKVETRIDYFWDLLAAHEDWCAVVEHVTSPRMPIDFVTSEEHQVNELGEVVIERQIRRPGAMALLTHQLPEGHSIASVPVGENFVHFICCTIRVSIYKADENRMPIGMPLRTGRGTKQVPLLAGRANVYADPNSLMKAETGAFGRALGFAGIFVIPGSGIATAEDMMESIAQGQPPAERPAHNEGPLAPPDPPVRTPAEAAVQGDEGLRARAGMLYKALCEEHPDKAEEFGRWTTERKLTSLGEAHGPVLRGVVKKLERLGQEAEERAQQGGEEGVLAEATPEAGDAQPSPAAG